MSEQRRLVPFEPNAHPNGSAPTTNGHHARPPLRVSQVVVAWTLGALFAASFIGRTQWLNLYAEQAGWAGRLAIPPAIAGAAIGLLRRRGVRDTAMAGAITGVASLWAVYGMVRVAVRVLWVDRSIVATILSDLGLLALVGSLAGSATGLAFRFLRERVRSFRSTPRSGP